MNKIKELRKSKKLNQTELAKRLGVDQKTVSRYEKEEIKLPPAAIGTLCDIFDCTSDYLLGLSDVNAKKPAADGSELVGIPDEFIRLQAANELYLQLDDVGRAQADAYLRFLVTQQEKRSGAPD